MLRICECGPRSGADSMLLICWNKLQVTSQVQLCHSRGCGWPYDVAPLGCIVKKCCLWLIFLRRFFFCFAASRYFFDTRSHRPLSSFQQNLFFNCWSLLETFAIYYSEASLMPSRDVAAIVQRPTTHNCWNHFYDSRSSSCMKTLLSSSSKILMPSRVTPY